MARVSSTPIEIGTSMLALPRFSERPGGLEEGHAGVERAGRGDQRRSASTSGCGRRRPSPGRNSPAQTGTENIIALPAPKPATPSARARRRPSAVVAARGLGRDRTGRGGIAELAPAARRSRAAEIAGRVQATDSLPVVRFSRALATPGRAATPRLDLGHAGRRSARPGPADRGWRPRPAGADEGGEGPAARADVGGQRHISRRSAVERSAALVGARSRSGPRRPAARRRWRRRRPGAISVKRRSSAVRPRSPGARAGRSRVRPRSGRPPGRSSAASIARHLPRAADAARPGASQPSVASSASLGQGAVVGDARPRRGRRPTSPGKVRYRLDDEADVDGDDRRRRSRRGRPGRASR